MVIVLLYYVLVCPDKSHLVFVNLPVSFSRFRFVVHVPSMPHPSLSFPLPSFL